MANETPSSSAARMPGFSLMKTKIHHHSPQSKTSSQLAELCMALEALAKSIADLLRIARVGNVDLSDDFVGRQLAGPRFSAAIGWTYSLSLSEPSLLS